MQKNMQPIVRTASFVATVLGVSSLGFSITAAVAEQTTSLDRRIANAMDQWEVPGLALVVVQEGKTVLMKGYGTSQHDRALNIDELTYLQIASNSKAVRRQR